MKERPILFSAPMVRAIIEGRKTMTRRIMKVQPYESEYESGMFHMMYRAPKTIYGKSKTYDPTSGKWSDEKHGPITIKGSLLSATGGINMYIPFCPYGVIGDQLWVRETFRTNAYVDGRPEYRATPACEEKVEECDLQPRWTPSIFMPRKYSRITLEITNVRVERLQNISDRDVESEGIFGYEMQFTPQHAFRILWESINGFESWNTNPWVWVIEFKHTEGDQNG